MRAAFLSILLAGAVVLGACGPSAAAKRAQTLIDAGDYAGAAQLAAAELEKNPRDGDLWRVRIRAALGQNDAPAAVAHYQAWHDLRGGDDPGAMRMMALTTLWQALESPAAQARIEAIRAVERLELERLADAVAERMTDDDDVVAAAAAIAILRAYPQAPQLATELLASERPEARAICVDGIGRKIGSRAADDLRPLIDDPDPRVRRAVVRALGAIADRADTERLGKVAAGDADPDVRAAALSALAKGKRGDLSALAREALTAEHLGIRVAAVALLDASRDDKTLVSLLTGADLVVAAHAARALARELPVEAAAALDRAIGDADWTVRAGALNLATAVVGKDGARKRATAALGDGELEVRLAAARLLGDDPKAIEVYVAALSDVGARLQAAVDLAALGDDRGLAALADLIEATQPSLRRGAAGGYGMARRADAGLVVALADDDPLVRVAAAEVILDVVPVE